MEPMGSSRLLTRKSSRSSTPVPAPRGWKPDQTLKPSTQGREATSISTRLMALAFWRLQPNCSMQQARMFSNTARMVEKEAKVINRKNRLPHSRPPGMEMNTLGRVMKIKEGPLSGLMPKEKQAGKMIRPEKKATKVSSAAMCMDSPSRVWLLSM